MEKRGKSALSIVQKSYPQVVSVVDAKRDAVIEVTARDCKKGRQKTPDSCAMARAFQRECDGAIISVSVAYIIKGRKATRYKVPQAVSREIVSFDRHHDFSPGEYRLNAPSECFKLQPLGKRLKREKTVKYANTKRRRHHTAGIRML